MPSIFDRIPKMTDQELLVLFKNANRQLSEGKNAPEGQSALVAIEHEWKRRLDSAKEQSLRDDAPAVGMLATLGYHVGATNGESTVTRRRILKHVLEGQLPMVSSLSYTEEWGLPNSKRRYSKLIQFLESQLNNPANQKSERAMIEWSQDLDWVRRTYSHLSS